MTQPANSELHVPAARSPHRQVLDNGIVLLVTPNFTADIIAARLFMRSGSAWEQEHNAGLLNLLASLLTKGTEKYSSLEIAEQVESVGAGLGTDAATDYLLLSLKTVSSDFEPLLQLASDILRSPTFPESEIELERQLTLQSIRSQKEQPLSLAFDALRRSLYGDHPYALSALGTETSVASLTRDDLLACHQQHFRPDNLVVSISGRIEPGEAKARVEAILGDWQAPPTPLSALELPEVTSSPSTVQLAQQTHQAIIMLGHLAPAVHDVHYAPMKLINTYLGNGMSSRLFVELREKQGLAYEISTFFPTRLHAAPFGAYMGTAPENAVKARDGLCQEVKRLSDVRLSDEELEATRNKLLGQYVLGKQTNSQIAQIYGWYETLNLGIDFDERFQAQVQAVTSEAIQATAQAYFAEPYLSFVGPEETLEQLIA